MGAGLQWHSTHDEDRDMPIRTASLNRRIEKIGSKLHLAMLSRIHSHGTNHEPSEAEQARAEEHRLLKEERAKRQAETQQPKAKADRLVRTHHAQAKDKPKARKEPKEVKAASKVHKPSHA